MLIIVDARLPHAALKRLGDFGIVFPHMPQQSAYPAIAAHPDIFFCPLDNMLVVSPSVDAHTLAHLSNNNVQFILGKTHCGNRYPQTAAYNAVVTGNMIIHHKLYTEPAILQNLPGHEFVHVNQGYTRCNLLPLGNNNFITSDTGIYKTLSNIGKRVMLAGSSQVMLEGYPHGFIGGSAGVSEKTVFFAGSLKYHHQGAQIRRFLEEAEHKIVELYDGPLIDGGSIFFYKLINRQVEIENYRILLI